MKSIGKQPVIERSYLDDKLVNTTAYNRTVYIDSKGIEYFNAIHGGKKIKVIHEGNNRILESRAKTIKTVKAHELFGPKKYE